MICIFLVQVRNSDLSWKEAKRLMKKDSRWNLVDLLEREEKEKYFTQHIEQLTRKKREKLRELLDETPEVTLTSSWKEIRRIIKEDPRYTKFSSSERVKRATFKFQNTNWRHFHVEMWEGVQGVLERQISGCQGWFQGAVEGILLFCQLFFMFYLTPSFRKPKW